MDVVLVKVFATALALSQVTTRPDDVKTQFDPANDRAEVSRLLTDGCTYMRKAFDIENINLDELIATAMNDKSATAADEVQGFRGIKFNDLYLAYRQICKKENVGTPVVDAGEVITFFNQAAADLPDHARLKNLRLPGRTAVLDGKGAPFAELFEPEHRRHWVPLSDVPEHVQKAFIAAEDKRFFTHRGVDERSVIRAFISTMGDPRRRQGGSTITQQVAKNLLVGDQITYERKIREIIVASRIEKALTKQEILEIYLNAIYLGRSSWGIDMAAQSYFGKPAKDLTVAEGAFLAGLVKGPNAYSPDRNNTRARERYAYVLDRLQEDGVITAADVKQAIADKLPLIPNPRVRREVGFHAVDQITREARAVAGIGSLTTTSYQIRSTINPQVQRAAEVALQDGLARYERGSGRARFEGPEMNLRDAIQKLEANPKADRTRPFWQQALLAARLPLYDVHWPIAVVVERGGKQGAETIRVGLRDGRIVPLITFSGDARRYLSVGDVVYVNVSEAHGKQPARTELRIKPKVQGAAVVVENATGRIIAMAGGFSYPLSQLNRAAQSRRQPGSALKPLTYLAALNSGLQPNTLVLDAPITLAPIGGSRYASPEDWWTPKNYDGGSSGTMTLRSALEHSKNLVTARLLDGGIKDQPPDSLDEVCRIAKEAQLYDKCERYYPFILGAQPVRPVDLAGFYAAIANEGLRPAPHLIDSIEKDGEVLYRATPKLTPLAEVDRAAVFQLRTILQGVLARGTARAIGHHAAYVGGKTGTSDEENDAWFVGFSNDVTIAVWVGYDNARGRRTLGRGATGGHTALPIFEPIMQAVWTNYAPKTVLRGPSREIARQLVAVGTEGASGRAFTEYLRVDRTGRVADTQYRLLSRGGYDGYEQSWPERFFGSFPGFDGYRRYNDGTPFFAQPRPEPQEPYGAPPYAGAQSPQALPPRAAVPPGQARPSDPYDAPRPRRNDWYNRDTF